MMRLGATLGLLLVAVGAEAAQLPDFTAIVSRNAPAVVRVTATSNGNNNGSGFLHQQQNPQNQIPPIFRRFFGLPSTPPQGSMARISLGSGFIISSDGYILTNDHVIAGSDKVKVRLQDRRTFTAKVVGADKLYDIALLKIKAHDLPTVTIGNSSTLKPGQWVLAIGSPFGFSYTVTQGIVSAVGRDLGEQDQPYTGFIQTDVPINRGNSGGPLFNLKGQVVGINSQIYSNTGGYMGVSFSIPINLAMDAVKQLKATGHVERGMLGVYIQPVNQSKATALGLKQVRGALINKVVPGSPAAKAGLQVGDAILGFDGHKVVDASELPPMVAATPPGTEATLKVFRNGKMIDVKVKLGKLQGNGSGQFAEGIGSASKFGFSVRNLTSDQRQELGLSDQDGGVLISQVDGNNAADAGLQPGDIVLMLGRRKIHNVAQFNRAAAAYKKGSTAMLLIRDHSGNTAFVTVTVGTEDSNK